MSAGPSIFKRAYNGIALVAVLNLLGLAALGAVLWKRKALTGEKLRGIVAVLRGKKPDASVAAGEAESSAPGRQTHSVSDGTDALAETQMDSEVLRLEGRRIRAELDQRLALNNAILLRVMTERERFQEETERAARQRTQEEQQRVAAGFKKQIAIFEARAPKVALEHLLAMSEPDEAARVLLTMNTRKAKKIVETAKRGLKMEKMKVILRRVKEVDSDRSVDLNPGRREGATP